jgi:hypothetical protein
MIALPQSSLILDWHARTQIASAAFALLTPRADAVRSLIYAQTGVVGIPVCSE